MAGWWSRIRSTPHDARSFEAMVLPHLDAGYNLARWLLHDDSMAQDAVQEAAMRALRYFGSLRGNETRPWFLGIVRNTCFDQLSRSGASAEQTGLDDAEMEHLQAASGHVGPDPAWAFDRKREQLRVDAAIRALPPPMREVIVLRELEELGYAEVAKIAGIPIGTVMSRLSRARAQLRVALAEQGVGH